MPGPLLLLLGPKLAPIAAASIVFIIMMSVLFITSAARDWPGGLVSFALVLISAVSAGMAHNYVKGLVNDIPFLSQTSQRSTYQPQSQSYSPPAEYRSSGTSGLSPPVIPANISAW